MWEGGNGVSEGGVVDLVNQDAKEDRSLVVRIGLQLRVDLDDEGRGHSGEQTGLIPSSAFIY